MKRLAAMQLWPPLPNRDFTAVVAAASRSASSRTTNGSEPPSSSTLFFSARPAAPPTASPARSLPVRVTAATRGSPMIRGVASARSASAITRVVNRCAGPPAAATASVNSVSMASAQPVTFGECLSTAALPATIAAHAKRSTCQNG